MPFWSSARLGAVVNRSEAESQVDQDVRLDDRRQLSCEEGTVRRVVSSIDDSGEPADRDRRHAGGEGRERMLAQGAEPHRRPEIDRGGAIGIGVEAETPAERWV